MVSRTISIFSMILFKFAGCVINSFVGAELAQQFLVLRRRGRDDVGAFPLCKLHSEMANAAAAAVNQNALSKLELPEIEQGLPRGKSPTSGTAAART